MKNRISKLLKEVSGASKFEVESPENEAFGDYSTNIALGSKNPRAEAEKILNQIKSTEESKDLFEKVEIAGPGFVNFWLKKEVLIKNLGEIDKGGKEYGKTSTFKGKKVMFEYGQPNTHKLPHIGHLFSYVYGETMTRLLEATGWEVRRVNYQGDVGLHVAKCLWALRKNKPAIPKNLEDKVKLLQKMYQEGSRVYEEDGMVKEEIQKINKEIYQKDASINTLWEETRTWSLDYYRNFEKRLGVIYDQYYLESEVQEKGKEKVLQNTPKVFKISQGAYIFEGSKFGLHDRVFVTKEGNPTYEAKDLYLEELKMREWPMDLLVITTASEQNDYFKVVFRALEETNPEMKGKLKHLGFGMVNLKTGKMASRTGEIIGAVELVDTVFDKVKEITKKNEKLPKDEIDAISETIALSAVKYSFLKNNPFQDTRFDIEESIANEGNSGPYLAYTVARTNSVLSKLKTKEEKLESREVNSEEASILRALIKFPEIVEIASEGYLPNLLCGYLYSLAQKFNAFYNKHRIIGEKEDPLRIAITKAVNTTLKNGLYLLGITTPERM